LLKLDSNPVAVVLGADTVGLGIIRNFGRRGIRTITLDDQHYRIAFFSKYGHKKVSSKAKLIETLKTIGSRYCNNAILFPTGDKFVDLIIQHRDDLSHYYRFPIPDNDLLKNILDKGAFYNLIRPLDVDIPKTWCCDDINNLDQITFPCILKPAYGYLFREYFPQKKVLVVHEISYLKKLLAYFSQIGLKMVIQEIVPGNDERQVSVAVYMDRDSVPLTTFVSRKVRQNPIGYGVGTYVEPYREDYLENKTKWLLSSIGYRGIAEVEFRYDERDSKYKLIEINPRPWAQNELAAKMGRDVIFAAYCDMAGIPYQKETKCEKTVWIYMVRDLISAFSYIRNGQLTLRKLVESYRIKKVEAIFSFDDPFPLFGVFYCIFIKGILTVYFKAQRLTQFIRKGLLGSKSGCD
jgi:D-aspartate ligase